MSTGPSGAGSTLPRSVSAIAIDNCAFRDFRPGLKGTHALGLAATTLTSRMWLERRTTDRDVGWVMARSPRAGPDLRGGPAQAMNPSARTVTTTGVNRGG